MVREKQKQNGIPLQVCKHRLDDNLVETAIIEYGLPRGSWICLLRCISTDVLCNFYDYMCFSYLGNYLKS